MLTPSSELRPKTANSKDRTVEVIYSTGADVVRGTPEIGRYIERITVSETAIDTSRIIGGPVLNSHKRGDLKDVIGQIMSVRVEGGQAIALVRIDDDDVWQRVENGSLRAVSAGYEVLEAAESEENGVPVRTATRWRPLEISFVPIGADAGAMVRSKETPMPDTPQIRAATATQLRQVANIASLGDDWIDTQVDAGASLEQARACAMETLEACSTPVQTISQRTTTIVKADHDAPEAVLPLMGEALYARANPSHELSEAARPYFGRSMVELGRELLSRRGIGDRSMTMSDVITRTLTTSDFPLIFADTVGRRLRAAYEAAPNGIKDVCRQTTARDFRTKHIPMLGEAPTLRKVTEAGEYPYGAMAETEETYSLETFGRIISITRQMIVNDDIGAFDDVARRMGIAAADFEVDQLVTLLESNPALNDGTPAFDANHSNLAATGEAISETTLSTARLSMRQQTGLSGQRINVVPTQLLVPAELETVAEKQLTSIQAQTVGNVNPFNSLGLVVESRLTDPAAWYVHSNSTDGLEYCYLEGQEGPQIESREGFNVDGVEIKVRLDFGAGFVDHRAFYKNPGLDPVE
ncbi:MAG: prohead protease/major capsid protein fusion protein [Pseudomonadota bacterium]